MARFEELDRYLLESNPDSMGWSEYAYETAVEKFAGFEPADWQNLCRTWRDRPRAWRMCLVTALVPSHSPTAGDVLLELIDDPDPEIAFEALRKAYYYCGVITVKGTVRLSQNVQMRSFLRRAQAAQSIVGRASFLSAGSSDHFQCEIAAFIGLLQEQGGDV